MAVRHLNYTGRKRIDRASVAISIDRFTNPLAFDATLDLDRYGFPRDAEVAIEASVDWTIARFQWGTAGEAPIKPRATLDGFEVAEGIRFAVKVLGTGPTAGLILGEASAIVPSDPEIERAARSFVDVRPSPLGDVAWKLTVDQSHPVLLVNNRVGDWKSFVRSAAFRTLVAPEVFRQLVEEASDSDPDFDGDDPGREWESQCLAMAARLSHQTLPIPRDANPRRDWIDSAVSAFATRHRLGTTLRTLVDQEVES